MYKIHEKELEEAFEKLRKSNKEKSFNINVKENFKDALFFVGIVVLGIWIGFPIIYLMSLDVGWGNAIIIGFLISLFANGLLWFRR